MLLKNLNKLPGDKVPSRRIFIKNVGVVAFSAPFLSSPIQVLNTNPTRTTLEVNIFSKHLQFLDLKEASQISGELGFDGLDLTVRPGGHIEPENVTLELPAGIQDIKNAGSNCRMITTAVSDIENPIDIEVIKTAAAQGVKYYRSNWFKYKENQSLENSLNLFKEKIHQLAKVNKTYNIVGCYQNHSGTGVGSSVWEIKKILETADPEFFGVQYDIRHAVAEGGQSWPNGIKLLQQHIKTIVLKDFKWGKVNGKWKIVNVPIGEGMVDFTKYFKILKSYQLRPPTSLHLEYPLGGAEKGKSSITVDKQVIYKAMKTDLLMIHKIWKQA